MKEIRSLTKADMAVDKYVFLPKVTKKISKSVYSILLCLLLSFVVYQCINITIGTWLFLAFYVAPTIYCLRLSIKHMDLLKLELEEAVLISVTPSINIIGIMNIMVTIAREPYSKVETNEWAIEDEIVYRRML